MRALTFLGEEMFYMIALTFVFWCLHRKLGFRLLFVLLTTAFVNDMGKWIVHRPRPYWFDPNVKGMVPETGYGPPSGHSQNPMAVWTYAAAWLYARGVRWFWAPALALIFLVGFSRMVLGVHFPHALIMGWTLGALISFFAWRWSDRAAAFFENGDTARRLAIAFGLPALLLAITAAVHAIALAGVDPQLWAANAALSQPDTRINPHSLASPVSIAGSMAGMLVSLILIRRTGEVGVDGAWLLRLLRFVLGFAVLIGISTGLKKVFPEGESIVALGARFLRYFLMLVWAIWLAPLVFVKIRLARPQEAGDASP